MAGLANYPIAVAPAMGHNFYFVFTVVVAMEVPWEVALGGVAVAGLLFIATAGFGLREKLITAIPASLKHAIATGIGLLIAMIGLQWAGVIVASPGTLVTLGDLGAPPVLVALAGLVVMAVLWARGVRGAILLGILASTLVAWLGGLVQFQGVAALPPSLLPTLGRLDILGALRPEMVAVVFVFFFLALFDSVGTLVAVGEQAGLMRNGMLPRARSALLADAVGTVVGAGLGTSTVTAYIESATGVAAGGRTGLTAVVIAMLFLLSLFFSPLVSVIGGGYDAGGGVILYPVVAPALNPCRHHDGAWGAPHRLGRPDRGAAGVPDDDGDAARGQHHRRHRVRVYRLRTAEARHGSWTRGALARASLCGAVSGEIRVSGLRDVEQPVVPVDERPAVQELPGSVR